MIVCGGDGCERVVMEAGGTNGNIAPDFKGNLEDRPRVDERSRPLLEQLLDPPDELPRWTELRGEGVLNVSSTSPMMGGVEMR